MVARILPWLGTRGAPTACHRAPPPRRRQDLCSDLTTSAGPPAHETFCCLEPAKSMSSPDRCGGFGAAPLGGVLENKWLQFVAGRSLTSIRHTGLTNISRASSAALDRLSCGPYHFLRPA